MYGLAATAALSRTGVTLTLPLLALHDARSLGDRGSPRDRVTSPGYEQTIDAHHATVGVTQLDRYDQIIANRHGNAATYTYATANWIGGREGPAAGPARRIPTTSCGSPIAEATMSFGGANRGCSSGELIQYSIPHLSSYHGPNVAGFKNSLLASRHLVNFPVTARSRDVDRMVEMSMSQALQ